MSTLSKIVLLSFILSAFACGSAAFDVIEIPAPDVPTPIPTPTIAPRGGSGGNGFFDGELPTVPQNLHVGQYGSNYIHLSWNDSSYEAGYKLYRNSALIGANIVANTVAYLDSPLNMDTEYCYKIKAYNNTGESDFSNEVCQTTPHCRNEGGPTLSLESAGLTLDSYPSVNDEPQFDKDNRARLNYTLGDEDACDSSFTVDIYLYKDGELIQTWADLSKGVGANFEDYDIPAYTDSPEGSYDFRVVVTDNDEDTQDVEKRWSLDYGGSYFDITTLPIAQNVNRPTVSYAGSNVTDACPGVYFRLDFTLTDDSITTGGLPNDWLHTYVYRKGTPDVQEHSVYDDSFSIWRAYPRVSSPVGAGVVREYYANAYDFQLNDVLNASTTNIVTVNITNDTAAPTASFNPALPGGNLEALVGVPISVDSSDADCEAAGFRYDYYFVYNGGTQSVTIASNTSSSSRTYTPAESLVWQTGYFEVNVRDSSGNETTIQSGNYTITPSLRPTVTLSMDTDPSHPTYYDIDYATSINVDIESEDTADATIVGLTYNGTDIPFGAYSEPSIDVPWTTPSEGGSVQIAVTISNNGYTASDTLNIMVGQAPTVTMTLDPESPFTTEQNITIQLGVTDNDMTGMQINYMRYTEDGINWNSILENVPYSGNENKAWTTPIFPGSYFIVAQVADSEGFEVSSGALAQVNPSDSTRTVIYLDYDLSGTMYFDQTVQFDIDSDGELEWTSWLNPSDCYLVMSTNVEDIDDFAFLNDLTASAGSVLDSSDALYNTVKIWIDADSDGVSDAGEVMSLSDAEISQIDLEPCCSFWFE